MTVKELIEELEKYPGDMEVWIADSYGDQLLEEKWVLQDQVMDEQGVLKWAVRIG